MSKKKKPYHHGNLRRALIDTATELIRERGMPEFTLRELARRLDVTHAATYHHFKDKNALLAAVAMDGHEALLGRLEESVEGASGSGQAIRSVGETYISFAGENAAHFGVMFAYTLPNEEGPTARIRGIFERLLREVERDGLVSGSPQVLAASAWASYHGVASLLIQGCLTEADDLAMLTERAYQCTVRPMPLAVAS